MKTKIYSACPRKPYTRFYRGDVQIKDCYIEVFDNTQKHPAPISKIDKIIKNPLFNKLFFNIAEMQKQH